MLRVITTMIVVAGLTGMAAESSAAQSTVSYSNPIPITINDRPPSFSAPPATAGQYPSTIQVSGAPGSISNATVTLRSFSHPRLSDVDVLVVAPSGQAVVILSDVPGQNFSNFTFTFDDLQTGVGAAGCDGIYNGAGFPGNQATFASSNCAFDEPFPSPAPSPSGTALTSFNGSSPNGAWQLYVVDDLTGEMGQIAGGWTLTLTLSVPPLSVQPPSAADLTAPNTVIGSGPLARTRSRRATFRFRSSETGSSFRCRLDKRAWRSCQSPRTYRRLLPGRHAFRVVARDAAGNLDPTPALRRWRILAMPARVVKLRG